MASPPITIGELTDVPAPDSPIASAWSQEVSRRVVHRFSTTAARDAAYPASSAGVGAVCTVAGRLYRSDGTTWMSDGEWQQIAGSWTGFLPGVHTFEQWFCRVGDIVLVHFQVIIASAGNAIVGGVGFAPTNLPQTIDNVTAIETWSCQYRSNASARFPGMIIATGSGMGFAPQALATGSGAGAPVGALTIASGVPMPWQNGASMNIAGFYRV